MTWVKLLSRRAKFRNLIRATIRERNLGLLSVHERWARSLH